jgi:ATP adenylyltransferase/5',5'''-P-1,P-4-tetraphosphate phosphorylase II
MLIQTLKDYAPCASPENGQDGNSQTARSLITGSQQLDLADSQVQEHALTLRELVPALLAHSQENHFIKFDPWDPCILIKCFPPSVVVYQYNPFRDAKNRQATGQKAATSPMGKPPDFLAWETFPQNEHYLVWSSSSGRRYGILVQPVPIVPNHLIIASLDLDPNTAAHYPQVMTPDMAVDISEIQAKLASLGYAMGFNGRSAGASVDHFHTQAVPKHFLPLINLVENDQIRFSASKICPNNVVASLLDCRNLFFWERARKFPAQALCPYPADALLLEADSLERIVQYKILLLNFFEQEKLTFNSIAWQSNSGSFREVVFPRGQESILNHALKAGYVEMSGMLVIPNKAFFDQITQAQQGEAGLREAGLTSKVSSYIFRKLLQV